jgi:hypothetical protein
MLVDDSNRGLGIWNVRKTGTVMWRCNFRPKRNPCKALVSQSGEKFIEHHPHACKSKEHPKINVLLSARAKKVALENIKEPALKFVEPLIVEIPCRFGTSDSNFLHLDKVSNFFNETLIFPNFLKRKF